MPRGRLLWWLALTRVGSRLNVSSIAGCESIAFCATVVGPVCGVDTSLVRVRSAGEAEWSAPSRLSSMDVVAYGVLDFELRLSGLESERPCRFGGTSPVVEARGYPYQVAGRVSALRAEEADTERFLVSVPTRGPGKYVVSGTLNFERCESGNRCDDATTSYSCRQLETLDDAQTLSTIHCTTCRVPSTSRNSYGWTMAVARIRALRSTTRRLLSDTQPALLFF